MRTVRYCQSSGFGFLIKHPGVPARGTGTGRVHTIDPQLSVYFKDGPAKHQRFGSLGSGISEEKKKTTTQWTSA